MSRVKRRAALDRITETVIAIEALNNAASAQHQRTMAPEVRHAVIVERDRLTATLNALYAQALGGDL